jgi:protein-tyrosine phosphatase
MPSERRQSWYWAEPDRIVAGEYPGGWNSADTRARLDALLDLGVNAFFDLTEADEGLRPYLLELEEAAKARGIDVEYSRYPIPDHTAPAPEYAEQIVEAVEEALAEGRKVYVHCYAGIGRTGTVVGIWMVRNRGISGAEAMETMTVLRANTNYGDWESPEMADQRRLVRTWQAGK